MDVAEFDYPLPPAAIAQVPAEPRDSARLLVSGGSERTVEHHTVADLADLLGAGDVLVLNETRVMPARLRMRKASGGAVEVLLLERRPDGWWEALVRPGRRVAPGTVLASAGGETDLSVEVGHVVGDGRRLVRLTGDRNDQEELTALELVGEVPLPPYITTPLGDPNRYQTVFARQPGSVAAPTAGLHLTDDVLRCCEARGVRIDKVDLKVGLGTFRPITSDKIGDHRMHSERYCISEATMDACMTADRVVAVGTTVVRALESAAATGALEGRTELFISRGHQFRVVDALMTNFHVPRSSLLVMIDAFIGPRWRDLYATAMAEGYRFLSFGDAMFLEREPTAERTYR